MTRKHPCLIFLYFLGYEEAAAEHESELEKNQVCLISQSGA